MKKSAKKFKELNKQNLIHIFEQIDAQLSNPLHIVVLGAAALLMLDIVERGTADIDVVNQQSAKVFQKLAAQIGVEVDIVSVCTTVDFQSGDQLQIFRGKYLIVMSINERDLIKSKWERYYKQDPIDIDKIIQKLKLSFSEFHQLALEASRDFIGNKRPFHLNILLSAENHFPPEQVIQLKQDLKM